MLGAGIKGMQAAPQARRQEFVGRDVGTVKGNATDACTQPRFPALTAHAQVKQAQQAALIASQQAALLLAVRIAERDAPARLCLLLSNTSKW